MFATRRHVRKGSVCFHCSKPTTHPPPDPHIAPQLTDNTLFNHRQPINTSRGFLPSNQSAAATYASARGTSNVPVAQPLRQSLRACQQDNFTPPPARRSTDPRAGPENPPIRLSLRRRGQHRRRRGSAENNIREKGADPVRDQRDSITYTIAYTTF